ncbi:hypothetical protein BKH43_00575 [Helicobacter sp. 13S00401-1]|uniref:flagellar basal body-associated FliL family protein n=1 Tax=Helicobacter sp. 13S00401-1 TaxID=1905758 RepID=UPI000BA6BB79|nr:flagellar basal body-associated FliL family protein [Helicobacter sp. 13S00401-1]PAF51764.1 hypothetical protein BKH43_00575 [Helicobacter sp. 13S00401-1]
MADEAKHNTKKGATVLFVILGVLIVILIIIGIVAFFFMGSGSKDDNAAPQNVVVLPSPNVATQINASTEYYKNPAAIYTMKAKDGIIVNLKPSRSDEQVGGYLKVQVQLVLDNTKGINEVSSKDGIISDYINNILSQYTAAEIQESKNKLKARAQIIANVNTILTTTRVQAVIFESFTVQPAGY